MERIETVVIFLSRLRRRRRKLTPKAGSLPLCARNPDNNTTIFHIKITFVAGREKWQSHDVSAHVVSQAKFILTDFIHWIDVYMPCLPKDQSIGKLLTALFPPNCEFSWQNFQKAESRCIQCGVQEIKCLWKCRDWDFAGNGKRDDKVIYFIPNEILGNINKRFKELFK